nr:hypothetical protein [uncultured Desulfobacter sp.]
MKNFFSFLGFLLVIGVAGQASAALIGLSGDGFEIGFGGWSSEGNVEIVNSTGYYAPSLETYSPKYGDWYAELSSGGTGGDVAYISQAISYKKGDTYSFDLLFLFYEGDGDDHAYYKIGDVVTELWTIGNWIKETIMFEEDGEGVLEIGVYSYDSTRPSVLLVDMTSVPAPNSLLLLGFGLFSIVGINRKNF